MHGQKRPRPLHIKLNPLSFGSIPWEPTLGVHRQPRQRNCSGAPRRTVARTAAGSPSSEDGLDWGGFDALEGEPAAQGDGSGTAAAAAAGSAAGGAPPAWHHPGARPSQHAAALERQARWDQNRKDVARSRVQHEPSLRELHATRRAAERELMEAGLGAEPCCCRTCGSLEMSAAEPAVVLVITVDYRFTISVPRFTCAEEGCPGTFAPSPFAAGCFPATPCVSWDVSQATQQHPARWFDMRLMQLGDALMYGVRRAVAAHSLANVVLTQHELNGCGGERINLDHLKRQLSDTIVVRGVGGSMDGSGRGDQVHAATHRALTPPCPPPPIQPPSPPTHTGVWLPHVHLDAPGQPGRA